MTIFVLGLAEGQPCRGKGASPGHGDRTETSRHLHCRTHLLPASNININTAMTVSMEKGTVLCARRRSQDSTCMDSLMLSVGQRFPSAPLSVQGGRGTERGTHLQTHRE